MICCLRRGRICLLLHGCRSLWQRRSGRLWGRIRMFLWCRIFILSGMRRIFLRFVRRDGRLRRARLCAGRAAGAGFRAGNFFIFLKRAGGSGLRWVFAYIRMYASGETWGVVSDIRPARLRIVRRYGCMFPLWPQIVFCWLVIV